MNAEQAAQICRNDPLIWDYLRADRRGDGLGTPAQLVGKKRFISLAIAMDEFSFFPEELNLLPNRNEIMAGMVYKAHLVSIATKEMFEVLKTLINKIQETYESSEQTPIAKRLPFPFIWLTSSNGFYLETINKTVDAFLFASVDEEPVKCFHCGLRTRLISGTKSSQYASDALAILLEEKIAVIEKTSMPKQFYTNKTPNPREAISVIRLRHIDYQRDPNAKPGESDREYHMRWLVRGHLRNQWFPARGVHELIWIDPYAKGPEDAPFKESIMSLVR